MAVQAQYPSNVLLLNRGVQDGKIDCSLQPQPGGFLDQSHMLFNNGVVANSRKRGREVFGTTNTGGVVPAPVNSFTLQPQPSQLIDLSILNNHQQNVVSTGLRLAFGEQHLQQHQNQQQQQQSGLFSLLSEDFTAQLKHQRDEVDQFLRAQGEQLRRTLAEKRQRHYRALLGAAEESVARRLREKEAEVEKAARRNAELEARAAQLGMEAQVWQARARAQEATAASLQAQLQQAMMTGGGCSQQERRGEDADGGGCSGQAEDAESAYVDPERAKSSGPMCKACRKRAASVVLMPCRHFCICTQCNGVVQACPLCLSLRDYGVEVFLS